MVPGENWIKIIPRRSIPRTRVRERTVIASASGETERIVYVSRGRTCLAREITDGRRSVGGGFNSGRATRGIFRGESLRGRSALRRCSLISFARRMELHANISRRRSAEIPRRTALLFFIRRITRQSLPVCLPACISLFARRGVSMVRDINSARNIVFVRFTAAGTRSTICLNCGTGASIAPRGVNVIFVATIKSCLLNFYGFASLPRAPRPSALIPAAANVTSADWKRFSVLPRAAISRYFLININR